MKIAFNKAFKKRDVHFGNNYIIEGPREKVEEASRLISENVYAPVDLSKMPIGQDTPPDVFNVGKDLCDMETKGLKTEPGLQKKLFCTDIEAGRLRNFYSRCDIVSNLHKYIGEKSLDSIPKLSAEAVINAIKNKSFDFMRGIIK